MMTLLTSGKLAAGKQNLIKEILILPEPGTPMKKVSLLFLHLLLLCHLHIPAVIGYKDSHYVFSQSILKNISLIVTDNTAEKLSFE